MNLGIFRKPSRYLNSEIHSIHQSSVPAADSSVRIALAFPDIYDIGMSHLGFKILYTIINALPFAVAERVFAPWTDMERYLREQQLPLCSLETGKPLREFDIVGFSLQYELSYPTILNMLYLGGIPVRREERDNKSPLVIAGGPCTVNPMPLSHYIDAFVVGDAEEKIVEILQACQGNSGGRDTLLKDLARVEGVFVPDYSQKRTKRIILPDLNSVPYPTAPVVPYTKIVHDRINIEVSRGCPMGCRFCQAGMIYRPVRERDPDTILSIAEETIRNTGYDEVSFTSLSAGDYSQLLPLLKRFNRQFAHKKIAVSLPSLRVKAVNDEMLRELQSVKRSGFTVAPEAASERLRKVINKDFEESDFEAALHALFKAGWQTIKLYFMIGLPTETWEDVKEIVRMAQSAAGIARGFRGRRVGINVGISPFVPKAHTPFQWVGQEETASLVEKKTFILRSLGKRIFSVKSHNEYMSFLEAAFSRGDAKTGQVIEKAWEYGAGLDGWGECFNFHTWEKAMENTGIDLRDYAMAALNQDDPLPWDTIDSGVERDFLIREFQNALSCRKTEGCSQRCHACGIGCKSREYLAKEPAQKEIAQTQVSLQRFIPVKVRVEFSKTEHLRYLSHLELMSVIIRALRRADVPLQYSEGFHPSPRISFGPALGVGIEGESEYFDMEVLPPFDIISGHERINRELPEGIQIKDMIFVGRKVPSLSSFINSYEYIFEFSDDTAVRRFEGYARKGTPFQSMIVRSVIINKTTIKIIFREEADRKVRMTNLLRDLFDSGPDRVSIKRTAMWGMYDVPISPMDVHEVEKIWKRAKENRGMHVERAGKV